MAHGYPDFEGGKSRVYSAADWAAIEGIDFDHDAAAVNQANGGSAAATHTTTPGRTFYLTQAQCTIHATLVADADNNQMCTLGIGIGVATKVWVGGNGGVSIILTKPIVVAAGLAITVRVTNRANHNCDLGVTFQGFEI